MRVTKAAKKVLVKQVGQGERIFRSVVECAAELGLNQRNLYRTLSKGIYTNNVYIIEYDNDMLENEVFKQHPELDLKVSNMGRIIGKSGRKTFGGLSTGGYRVFRHDSNKLVHRLVMETFEPNPNSSKLTVDHINRDKNLRWCTMAENNANTRSTYTKRVHCPTCSCNN